MERMERILRTARTSAGGGSAARRSYVEERGADIPRWDLMDVPVSSMDALRSEVGLLRDRLAQAAPKRAVLEMDRAISLLYSRVEEMRDAAEGGHGEDISALTDELHAVKASLDTLKAPERFRALSAGVEMLSRKIDVLGLKAVDPVEMARLQGQTTELKDLVSRALSGAGLQPIAERLAVCAEQVARTGAETERRMAEATAAFERNTEALLAKVQQMEVSTRHGQNLNTEELRRDLQSKVQSIHQRIDHLGEQLAALSPVLGAEFTGRLAALLDRIEKVEGIDKAAVAPLSEVVEHHLMALTERFHDAHSRLSRLDGIETSLNRMIDELRYTRENTANAAAEAAQAVAAKVSEDPNGPAVVGLKRGLAALEARQSEIERRAGELLGDQLATDLEDLAVGLDRDGDDVWVPRAAEPPFAAHRRAPYFDDAGDGEPRFTAPEPEAPRFEEPRLDVPGFEEPRHEDTGVAEPCMEEPRFAGPEAGEARFEDALAAEAARRDDARFAEPNFTEPNFAEPDFAEPGFAAHRPEAAERAATIQAERPAQREALLHAVAEPVAEPKSRARHVDGLHPLPGDLRARRAEGEEAADAHWTPSARRAERADERPRIDRRKMARRGTGADLRRKALIGLMVSAGVVLAATSVSFAWNNGADVMARMTQAVSRLKTEAAAPQPAQSTSELPPPVGPAALRQAALDGNLAAAYEVGVRLADGIGTDIDLDAAIKWLGYAVGKGYAPAAYRLGSIYEFSVRNMDEAYRFYKWAAEQGNVRAMHNLAVLYSQGLDGSPNWPLAIDWFRKAANLGLKDSQHNLGIIFARGLSGKSDLVEAWKWFAVAAKQGDQDSAEKRDALAKQADPATMLQAKQAAAGFQQKPLDEAVNVVMVPAEWNTEEAAAGVARVDPIFSHNLVAAKR